MKQIFTKWQDFEIVAKKRGLTVETERMSEGMTPRDDEAATYAFNGKRLADEDIEILGQFVGDYGVLFDDDDEYLRWCHEGDEGRTPEQEEAVGIRNVLAGFAKGRNKAGGASEMKSVLLHAAQMTNWRQQANEELNRRVWSGLMNALTDEQLAAIATGQIDFAALCREAAERA